MKPIFSSINSASIPNFKEIGVSDHMPLPDGLDPEHRMSVDEYKTNKLWYDSVDEEFGDKNKIKFGIGAEYIAIPEEQTDYEEIRNVLKGFRKDKTSSIIIVAEGDEEGGAFDRRKNF